MYGYKPKGDIGLPDWARTLTNYYWMIRVEKYNEVKRRRYYRYVQRAKLRLVESGIDQELVNAICRYLANFSIVNSRKLRHIMEAGVRQMPLDF